MSLADARKKATRQREEVRVCFNRALVHELEQTRTELGNATNDGMLAAPEGAQDLAEREQRLLDQVNNESVTLVFEFIGKQERRDLMAAHPPKDESGTLKYDPETFYPALLVASCTEPGLTDDDAQWLINELPDGLFDRIWEACLLANFGGAEDPKALSGTAALLLGVSRWTTADPEDFPAASS